MFAGAHVLAFRYYRLRDEGQQAAAGSVEEHVDQQQQQQKHEAKVRTNTLRSGPVATAVNGHRKQQQQQQQSEEAQPSGSSEQQDEELSDELDGGSSSSSSGKEEQQQQQSEPDDDNDDDAAAAAAEAELRWARARGLVGASTVLLLVISARFYFHQLLSTKFLLLLCICECIQQRHTHLNWGSHKHTTQFKPTAAVCIVIWLTMVC